jgi:hypothetical protein
LARVVKNQRTKNKERKKERKKETSIKVNKPEFKAGK